MNDDWFDNAFEDALGSPRNGDEEVRRIALELADELLTIEEIAGYFASVGLRVTTTQVRAWCVEEWMLDAEGLRFH